MFNRWSHRGVWERLLAFAQQRGGIEMGVTLLDGHDTCTHQKAAGAAKKAIFRTARQA